MADFNSTDPNVQVEGAQNDQSGEQEKVVDSQESHNNAYDDFVIVDDGHAGAVDQHDTDGNDDADAGEGASEKDDSDNADQKEHQQSREDNAAARAARLRATKEAEARAEASKALAKAEADKRIRESGVINPYTKMPFNSVEEFEEYGRKVKESEIAKKAKETGKSVAQLTEEAENAEYIRRKRQEESEAEAKRKAEADRKEFFKNDLVAFMERYPAVDVTKLDNNQQFRKFCGSRYGKEPLADLYESYIELVGDAGKAATIKAEAKSARSTGAGEKGGEVLSPEQRKALDEWNRDNPEMAMTPKEFLSR